MITAKMLDTVGAEIEAAVKAIAKKHNIDIEYNGGTYGEASGTLKMRLTSHSKEAKNRQSELAKMLGFKNDIIGKRFDDRASVFTITDINLNRKRYPISATNQNGTGYKFSADSIKSKTLR